MTTLAKDNTRSRVAVTGGGELLEYGMRRAGQARFSLFLPAQHGPHSRVLAAIHGISRNVDELLSAFIPYAQRHGVILLAPLFAGRECAAYQRLGGPGQRSDHMLNEMLDQVQAEHAMDCRRFSLFGYSGGAQFAQRYTFAYPQRVCAVALGAPGWFTMPDKRATFPRGIAPSRKMPGLQLDPDAFLDVPACVFVGARDTRIDKQLNCSPRIVQAQGRHRLQRAGRWVRAMQDAARMLNKPTLYTRQVLPGAGHSFAECVEKGHLAKRTFAYLFATSYSEVMDSPASPASVSRDVCA